MAKLKKENPLGSPPPRAGSEFTESDCLTAVTSAGSRGEPPAPRGERGAGGAAGAFNEISSPIPAGSAWFWPGRTLPAGVGLGVRGDGFPPFLHPPPPPRDPRAAPARGRFWGAAPAPPGPPGELSMGSPNGFDSEIST